MDHSSTQEKPESGDISGKAHPDTHCVYTHEDHRGRLSIFESIDKSCAFVEVAPLPGSDHYSAEDLTDILKKTGITFGLRHEAIRSAAADLASGSALSGSICIAEGVPPVHGTDSEVELLYDRSSPYAEPGQVILRVGNPVPGKPGTDVYGNPITPKPGRFKTVSAGENVLEQDGNAFASEIYGWISLDGNRLAVHKIIEVTVTPDEMEAQLSYTGAAHLTRERILAELYSKKVVSGIDHQAIDVIVASCATDNKPVTNCAVARGTPSRPGRDGEIIYKFDAIAGPRYRENENGSINIRETNRIQSVSEGQEIAELIPHVEPTYGKSVYGKIIAPPKVKKASLSAGKNVAASSDGTHFFARASGLPVIERDTIGSRISVSEICSVDGNLDLSIGNIDFDGVVQIGGDVEDGFTIKASKSIIISGVVGACVLESGIDIRIFGGCNGKDQARITCGGNLEARYLNEVQLISGGDVTIHNEIVNSTIQALGRVLVKSGGSIRGGTITAKGGIESHDIGSEMGVKTVLVPGEDYRLNGECRKIDEKIITVNNEMAAIRKRIAPLLQNKELLAKLPVEQRDKLRETVGFVRTLQEQKKALNAQKNVLIVETLQDACPEVVVHKNIFQGALLKIGSSRREISSPLEGPLRLYEDNDRVTVEPYSETTAWKRRAELTQQALAKYADQEASA